MTTPLSSTRKRTTRRRRRKRIEPNPHAACIGSGLLGFVFLFLCFLWKAQDILDSIDDKTGLARRGGVGSNEPNIFRNSENENPIIDPPRHLLRQKHHNHSNGYDGKITYLETNYVETRTAPNRYLIFRPIGSGQGQGNIMAGLLAAHLLADEFDRVVCVSPSYQSFLSVFEPIHPWALEKCSKINIKESSHLGDSDEIRLVTFERPPNECELQKILRDGPNLLYLTSNTYPRWPKVPTNYFFRFYRPRQSLLDVLPYDKSPEIVVHLREGDAKSDRRKGTDNKSLNALGEMLPKHTFLVTNRVDWYDLFGEKYGWSNPGWDGVTHSALGKSWGVRGQKFQFSTSKQQGANSDKQRLQLWADWYTILTAKKVYHSHSDFSISAIHWVGSSIEHSQTLLGYNRESGKIDSAAESYIVDGETAPLKDRSLDANGTSQLRLCESEFGVLGNINKRKKWRQDRNSDAEDA